MKNCNTVHKIPNGVKTSKNSKEIQQKKTQAEIRFIYLTSPNNSGTRI